MEMLILKTNINSPKDFKKVQYTLNNSYQINECTVDLGDRDKVLRWIMLLQVLKNWAFVVKI